MILLDTHTLVWSVVGRPISAVGRETILVASEQGDALVSAVTVWELTNLVRGGRIDLQRSTHEWLESAVRDTGLRLIDLTPAMALEAGRLPDWAHRDPADRLLVATARLLVVPLVTRDEEILRYAALGHLAAIAC